MSTRPSAGESIKVRKCTRCSRNGASRRNRCSRRSWQLPPKRGSYIRESDSAKLPDHPTDSRIPAIKSLVPANVGSTENCRNPTPKELVSIKNAAVISAVIDGRRFSREAAIKGLVIRSYSHTRLVISKM